MDVDVSKDQLKEVSDVLAAEGVNFQITDKTFSLMVDGKEIAKSPKSRRRSWKPICRLFSRMPRILP